MFHINMILSSPKRRCQKIKLSRLLVEIKYKWRFEHKSQFCATPSLAFAGKRFLKKCLEYLLASKDESAKIALFKVGCQQSQDSLQVLPRAGDLLAEAVFLVCRYLGPRMHLVRQSRFQCLLQDFLFLFFFFRGERPAKSFLDGRGYAC